MCVRLKDFPFGKNIVFVDTPGLDDPVDYRSKVTRDYIDRANAVIVCVQAKTLTAKEVDTIYRIFDNTRGKPEKVYVLGTQYDTPNNPLKDWEQQKQSWIKYLSSDRDKDITQFTKIQAEKNIIQVSGYVSLLLDLYEKDKIDDDGRKKIKECSFKFFEDTDFEKHIEGLRKISNIHMIFERIKEDILQTAE
ncbi:hypothetical protein [Helicobacter trogontum]|uniref:Dynamin N-terminal domain-containing protein n=1 Tax=Helicobacter trogontum TaxID=50960 RepID=A0A4U8TET7_9HELI|nr:hypothetical protein [Helicobacter trogontum]MDY5185513.1 hypothetical protein [Helicobacter trogontum]TLD98570.1 hypothetical protein LS80_004525 [Helicobacter trogontum]